VVVVLLLFVEIVAFVVDKSYDLYNHNNKTTTTSTVSLNLVTQEEDNNKSYNLYNNKTRTTSTATVLI
jgi:hypothetical protein